MYPMRYAIKLRKSILRSNAKSPSSIIDFSSLPVWLVLPALLMYFSSCLIGKLFPIRDLILINFLVFANFRLAGFTFFIILFRFMTITIASSINAENTNPREQSRQIPKPFTSDTVGLSDLKNSYENKHWGTVSVISINTVMSIEYMYYIYHFVDKKIGQCEKLCYQQCYSSWYCCKRDCEANH